MRKLHICDKSLERGGIQLPLIQLEGGGVASVTPPPMDTPDSDLFQSGKLIGICILNTWKIFREEISNPLIMIDHFHGP